MIVQSLGQNNNEEMKLFDRIKYVLHFLTRAFLIAVFIMFLSLIIFFIVYFGDLLYNVKIGNNKAPLFGAYVIVSPSMVPTIKINDAIVVKRVKSEYLKIGDIITFSSSDPSYAGLTITHRIVGKQMSQSGEYVYRTKGDNNNVEDSALVKGSDVYGKVILKIPKLGYVQKFLSTPFGFIISILIPIIMVLIGDIMRIFQTVFNRQKLDKKEEIEII